MNVHVAGADVAERAAEIAKSMLHLEGPLMPTLHAVMDEFGYVPEEALPAIAKVFNLSRAEVHGVVSFYHDFRREPAGKHVLKLCRAEACQSMGCDALANEVKQALGVDFHETTKDGNVTLEPVFCLGLCSCAPAAMLDETLIGRADLEAIKQEIAEAGQ